MSVVVIIIGIGHNDIRYNMAKAVLLLINALPIVQSITNERCQGMRVVEHSDHNGGGGVYNAQQCTLHV